MDAIGAYVAQLRRDLRWRKDVDAIAAEAEDHLRESAAAMTAGGVPPERAQQEAVRAFGSADAVARAFVSGAHGTGIAVPTRFTRAAGFAGIAAALLWADAALVGVVGYRSLIDSSEWEPTYFALAALITLLAGATTVALTGLLARSGSGRSGRAFVVAGAGIIATLLLAVFTWGWAIGALPLSAAALLVGLSLTGAPRAAALVLAAAWPVGLLLTPLAFAVAFVTAALMSAGSLLAIGRTLAREAPAPLGQTATA